MPQLSKRPLHRQVDWLSDSRSLDRRIRKTPNKERVIFISDPFTEYFQPDTGLAALHVLSAIGCSVVLLPVVGTGRTLISKGFLREARAHASRVVSAIQKIDPSGEMDIVGVEPSEIYTLRDEYQDFFPEDEQVTALAERIYMVDEFLIRPGVDQQERVMRIADLSKSTSSKSTRVLLHGHCYQKSQPPRVDGFPVGVRATQQLLERAGYFVDLIDSGCCGMAGAFGYESDHYDLSLDIGELSLFPAVRNASQDMIVAAAGFSCLTQIEEGTSREAIHPINLIRQILES
jgi:Fe-S oxidoreductase